jgi:hypothetical protein
VRRSPPHACRRTCATRLTRLAPRPGHQGYSRLGAALHGLGALEDALRAYEDGLKIEPDNAVLKKGMDDVDRALSTWIPYTPRVSCVCVPLSCAGGDRRPVACDVWLTRGAGV